jgi:hypothetical protein
MPSIDPPASMIRRLLRDRGHERETGIDKTFAFQLLAMGVIRSCQARLLLRDAPEHELPKILGLDAAYANELRANPKPNHYRPDDKKPFRRWAKSNRTRREDCPAPVPTPSTASPIEHERSEQNPSRQRCAGRANYDLFSAAACALHLGNVSEHPKWRPPGWRSRLQCSERCTSR